MQHFSNSPVPPSLPPGFSGRSGGGPTYPPQPADPHISPRMAEDYTAMQQASLHRGHPHPSQASHMLAYSGRARGVGDSPAPQANLHGSAGNSGGNPYRKEAMDYYFSMGGKERHRRGGVMGYGAGFGYPGVDGHIPQQYRHAASGSAQSPGMMSPYPVDYGATAGSGGEAGAFSPSHQYSLSQNPASMQLRQQGQGYQSAHHGQQHRNYPQASHRMNPQYPHYSPQGGTPSGSSGMYSPPPQRYHDGTGTAVFDPKVNSSAGVAASSNSASSASAAPNNVTHMENVQQSYHASPYPGYSPQSHTLHKQAPLQHHSSQHGRAAGYDPAVKMQQQGPSNASLYAKHHQASNPNIPHTVSQEIAKSPMHSNAQQNPINQNFSPVSNPSPAASAVQSPNCSSSPSPLMGVPEAHGNPAGHPPAQPIAPPRGGHGQGRVLQTVPQLSPTPNSNSSISSCGSSGGHKPPGVNAAMASGHSSNSRSRMGAGMGDRSREDGSAIYSSPLEKMQDAGLNSLNALTSQVANLPNTVQHMLLTDTVFSQKKGKDGGQMQQQQQAHAIPQMQQRSRNASAASSTSTVREGSGGVGGDGSEAGADEDSLVMSERGPSVAKVEREEQYSEGEHRRARQMSGASSGSEPAGFCPPSHSLNQSQAGKASHDKTMIHSEPMTKQTGFSEMKPNEARIPSASPSVCPPPAEPGQHYSTAPVSRTHTSLCDDPPPKQNCRPEPPHGDNRYGHRKMMEVKKEVIKSESGAVVKTRDKGDNQMQGKGEVNLLQDGRDKENRFNSGSSGHSNERDGPQKMSEEQQNASSVGVIVSSRPEGGHPDKTKGLQDPSAEEKGPRHYVRDPSSRNGEEGVDLTVYSAHHQLHQKPNFGRSQNHPQLAPHKYSYPEPQYGPEASLKSRGRSGPGGAMEAVSRYPGQQQPQSAYGPNHSKDLVEASLKRTEGAGPRVHEDNAQLQQFPSLLQEVLQGYNLDRRYGRAEQAFPPHLQLQQQFQTRHGFSMTGMTEAALHSTQMANSGKPQQLNHKQGPASTDAHSKIPPNGERAKGGMSQGHFPQAIESVPPPTKHINLADYSLPQKKTLSTMTHPSSAVQELLLQETEPLTGSSHQTETQKSSATLLTLSSERRSVICDVSPNRRSTPEREERERDKGPGGSSVIQEPFPSVSGANDLSKKDPGVKPVVKMEMALKDRCPSAANMQPDRHASGSAKEGGSKHVHPVDSYRRGHVDMSPMPPHPGATPNPLSPPSRHQAYGHGFDLTSGHASGFPGYRYGDTREGGMMQRGNPHFPSHHPYHNLSPQAQLSNPQSTTKHQMYPHPCGPTHPPQDISEWVAAMNRPSKEMMMMQSGTSPGRHKLPSQSEQRVRMVPQTDGMSNEPLTKTTLPHQSPYYDIKMWEASHGGREGAVLMEGDPYYRTAPPTAVPPPSVSVVPHGVLPLASSSNLVEPDVTRGATEEPKPARSLSASSSIKPFTEGHSAQLQGPRPAKVGGSGDTNPLMLRRRVRSFISPIPAKRQLQEARAALNSHHSPGAQSESSHNNEDDSSSSDIVCPRLSSPISGENAYSQSMSPSGGKSKPLTPRKGRGLKLEAIVQKITPNVQKPMGLDGESNHYPGYSHPELASFSDSQSQDHYPRVVGGDDGYLDEGHSLNDLTFRGVDDAGPLPPIAYPCEPHQTSQGLKQTDFDFGLGAAVVSASGDKEDFTLLGPLPPPPPLPRPVQGSPPPSSSALSDIQHFTNTYQQLETRRGEQSAANLLRQKLQESGIGFEDYPGRDYYATTPPHHSQTPGLLLSRPQHHMSSGRSSLSPQDCKMSDSSVPKGYFPSGKKKGRPVGSVNKQKRAQGQSQNTSPGHNSMQGGPLTPSATSLAALPSLPPPPGQTCSSMSASPPPPLVERPTTPPLAPPVLTQVVKVDVESEDIHPEVEVKLLRRRRRGVKEEGGVAEVRGRQRRRRRVGAGAAPMPQEDRETSPCTAGPPDPSRKGPSFPHIHVEKKVPEVGAVCTIVNANDEEKLKGERSSVGGKTGLESLLASAFSTQLSRREREAEQRESDEAESSLPAVKALPSSGYVVSGPVITETNHSGRLLCCLCQKWANYKHLGDLYGPYYPAEYATRLPKNQPQVRQGQATAAANRTGPSSDNNSNVSNSLQDSAPQDCPIPRPPESDYAISLLRHATSPHLAVSGFSPAGADEMMMMYLSGKLSSSCSSGASKTPSLSWDMHLDTRPIPELKREPDLEVELLPNPQPPPPEEAQQRPQHRKLTSHPRFKRRHKSTEDSPRMVPSNSKASLPFQPPPPALDSLGPLAQLAQLPQMPMDPEELWFHEGCMAWTSGVYLVNGRLYGLQEALDGARETNCSYCEAVGSTLGCYTKGCTLRYHYLCAMEADCTLNEDNFSLRCPKHKVKIESSYRVVGQPSRSSWNSQREVDTNEEEETPGSGDWKDGEQEDEYEDDDEDEEQQQDEENF
ncbi:transcription factor 20 isoform X1 [Gadus chalcogrammus]|uniref:transcription factor 20 isoform X1 n=1 Tax=Gadus chalcogrammus TaxID=1042646 RepID=UPI0024C3F729|nr:transcription factor 20 isoform X1 [Gadus chalcogrammus]